MESESDENDTSPLEVTISNHFSSDDLIKAAKEKSLYSPELLHPSFQGIWRKFMDTIYSEPHFDAESNKATSSFLHDQRANSVIEVANLIFYLPELEREKDDLIRERSGRDQFLEREIKEKRITQKRLHQQKEQKEQKLEKERKDLSSANKRIRVLRDDNSDRKKRRQIEIEISQRSASINSLQRRLRSTSSRIQRLETDLDELTTNQRKYSLETNGLIEQASQRVSYARHLLFNNLHNLGISSDDFTLGISSDDLGHSSHSRPDNFQIKTRFSASDFEFSLENILRPTVATQQINSESVLDDSAQNKLKRRRRIVAAITSATLIATLSSAKFFCSGYSGKNYDIPHFLLSEDPEPPTLSHPIFRYNLRKGCDIQVERIGEELEVKIFQDTQWGTAVMAKDKFNLDSSSDEIPDFRIVFYTKTGQQTIETSVPVMITESEGNFSARKLYAFSRTRYVSEEEIDKHYSRMASIAKAQQGMREFSFNGRVYSKAYLINQRSSDSIPNSGPGRIIILTNYLIPPGISINQARINSEIRNARNSGCEIPLSPTSSISLPMTNPSLPLFMIKTDDEGGLYAVYLDSVSSNYESRIICPLSLKNSAEAIYTGLNGNVPIIDFTPP